MVDVILLAVVTFCCVASLYDLHRYHSFEEKRLNVAFWRGTMAVYLGIVVAALRWGAEIEDAWSRVSSLQNVWIEGFLFVVVAFDATLLVGLAAAFLVILFIHLFRFLACCLGRKPRTNPEGTRNE